MLNYHVDPRKLTLAFLLKASKKKTLTKYRANYYRRIILENNYYLLTGKRKSERFYRDFNRIYATTTTCKCCEVELPSIYFLVDRVLSESAKLNKYCDDCIEQHSLDEFYWCSLHGAITPLSHYRNREKCIVCHSMLVAKRRAVLGEVSLENNRKSQAKFHKRNPGYGRKYERRYIAELTSGYVKNILKQELHCAAGEVPLELIPTKRKLLQNSRLIKEARKKQIA